MPHLRCRPILSKTKVGLHQNQPQMETFVKHTACIAIDFTYISGSKDLYSSVTVKNAVIYDDMLIFCANMFCYVSVKICMYNLRHKSTTLHVPLKVNFPQFSRQSDRLGIEFCPLKL